jgi:hypothetical protein
MAKNKIEARAEKLLIEQWNAVKQQLTRAGALDTRPDDGYGIFSLVDYPKVQGQVQFNIAPVTFNVPERADSSSDLYIVAEGRIYLDYEALEKESRLSTVGFATQVGYFRLTIDGKLCHVYGAHYDFSEDEIGHPVFHGQMKSFNEHGALVSETFTLDCESTDLIKGVLRNVRVPTAQMDFFSVILQICADHLISADSGEDQKDAFNQLREASRSLQGAGHLWPQLKDVSICMKSHHWYR